MQLKAENELWTECMEDRLREAIVSHYATKLRFISDILILQP